MLETAADVRFGSLADICSAKGHVSFAPNSDRESGFPQTVMSALPPKADMCGATRDVRFVADMATSQRDGRFTPNSGHCVVSFECPLSANSGHEPRTCSNETRKTAS